MIHFITPCTRPDNLPKLEASIKKAKLHSNHDVLWHVCFDSSKVTGNNPINSDCVKLYSAKTYCNENPGKSQINFVLTHFKLNIFEGFIYVLDDDNIIPDNFLAYNYNKEESLIYLFPQLFDKTSIREIMPACNRIDQAQILCHSSIQEFYSLDYNGDSKLIEKLCMKHPYKEMKNLVYYNYLTWI